MAGRTVRNCAQLLVVVEGYRIDDNVVMQVSLVDVGGYYVLIFALGKFGCQLFAQLMGLFRCQIIVRREGLYQVISQVPAAAFTVVGLACGGCRHLKVEAGGLWLGIIAGHIQLTVRFVRVFDVSDCLTESGFYRVDFGNGHSSFLSRYKKPYVRLGIIHRASFVILNLRFYSFRDNFFCLTVLGVNFLGAGGGVLTYIPYRYLLRGKLTHFVMQKLTPSSNSPA